MRLPNPMPAGFLPRLYRAMAAALCLLLLSSLCPATPSFLPRIVLPAWGSLPASALPTHPTSGQAQVVPGVPTQLPSNTRGTQATAAAGMMSWLSTKAGLAGAAADLPNSTASSAGHSSSVLSQHQGQIQPQQPVLQQGSDNITVSETGPPMGPQTARASASQPDPQPIPDDIQSILLPR